MKSNSYPSIIKLLLFIGICFSSNLSFGQYQIGLVPRVSPDQGVYQKVGFTEIDIKYGSPKTKGRKIWGELVPYGEVWRTGANEATTIEFSEDVIVEGKTLAKGKYAFFLIPKKNNDWIAIFNRKNRLWGAFGYDSKDDELRVRVKAKTNSFNEALKYSIQSDNYQNATISLLWDKIKIDLNIETNYLKLLEGRLNEKLEKASEQIHWVIYLQAAEFLLLENKELDKALAWINKSEQLSDIKGEWHHQYYPKVYVLGHMYWTKASILAQLERYQEALNYVALMQSINEENGFYEQENTYGDLDYFINEWEYILKN